MTHRGTQSLSILMAITLIMCGTTLFIGCSVLCGVEKNITRSLKQIKTKKRKRDDTLLNPKNSSAKTAASLLRVDNLPSDIHDSIIGMLSNGIHSWDMWDTSAMKHQAAVSSWVSFSLVSKAWRNYAHHWAIVHFNITDDEYNLFKQIKGVSFIVQLFIEISCRRGEISYINRAELQAIGKPYTLVHSLKRGLILEQIKALPFLPGTWNLSSPFGRICLFPNMSSDKINDIETVLANRVQLAYNTWKIEKAESYGLNERRTRTDIATRIVWNIFSARYAEERAKDTI